MELEIKDIELNSQKKKYECLLLKVRHLNREVEFKSLHILKLENEINNLNLKWKNRSNSRTKAHVSELETEIENLSQKLKRADEKAIEDQIQKEKQLKTIKKQETELNHQRDIILQLKGEIKSLSQKQTSFQPDVMEQELQQQVIKKGKTHLEVQKISDSNIISTSLLHTTIGLEDANYVQRNSRNIEKSHNQLMADKENYPANIIPGLRMETEEVPIIDLTENFFEENEQESKDEFIDHISEMTNEIELKQDRKIAHINTILSTSFPNQSQEVTWKSLKVIHPKKTSKRHISKSKKENKLRLNKEALVFKSILTDKNNLISKVHKNKCKICSKGFATNSALIIHVDGVHKKIKPHRCKICSKGFATSAALIIHVDGVHKNIRPHTCPICLKEFTQSGHMRTHVNFVHKKIRGFKCTICSKDFVTNHYLKRHMSTFHKKMNP